LRITLTVTVAVMIEAEIEIEIEIEIIAEEIVQDLEIVAKMHARSWNLTFKLPDVASKI